MTKAQKEVVDAAVKLIGESTSERDIDPIDYRVLRMAVQELLDEEMRSPSGGHDG